MKNTLKKTNKLLLVIALIALISTPIYSMINVNGFIWEVDFEDCTNCGECCNYTDLIALGDNDAYFKDGNIIGESSFYLDYSPTLDPLLAEAMDMCPSHAISYDIY